MSPSDAGVSHTTRSNRGNTCPPSAGRGPLSRRDSGYPDIPPWTIPIARAHPLLHMCRSVRIGEVLAGVSTFLRRRAP